MKLGAFFARSDWYKEQIYLKDGEQKKPPSTVHMTPKQIRAKLWAEKKKRADKRRAEPMHTGTDRVKKIAF